jgi:eukaryotic-like serine/threonine-protein kinase
VAELETGTLIDGRYKVLSRLGSGGMADVFLAEDQQLGRKVALKLLHRRFSEDPGFVERFRREAQAAAGLQHPNVVSVYDRGAYDDTYYIAMEYLPGRSLKQVIRQEAPIDPVRAIDITIQILKAARFAHRHGVIHRDLKPHNVIVDDAGHVKVTDFGIARAGASDMTETGSIMGTAQYLSPEQAQGHAVSASSDLYSVGVVLYELLTAHVPFDAEAAVTIALKHVSEAPTAPTTVNPSVPPELEQVVMWALNKNPADRPQNADDFIAALEAAKASILSGDRGQRTAAMAALAGVAAGGGALAGAAMAGGVAPPAPPPVYDEPLGEANGAVVAAVPPPPYDETPRRRNPWPWIALVLVLLLLGGGAAWYLSTRPKQVTVPPVTGEQINIARTVLQNEGFSVNVININSNKPSGIVTAENPNGDTKADKGSTVTLTVSQGPGNVNVPTVLDLSLKAAKRQITKSGLNVGRVVFESSNQIPANNAIGTDPSAGQSVTSGSSVTLLASDGAPKVQVPNVTGDSVSQAKSTLQTAGFSVTTTKQTTTTTTAGNVISQSPAGNASVAPGSTINLVIAQAPTTASVPATHGQTAAAATSALQAAGFKVGETTMPVTDKSKNGVVLHQTPKPGTTAKKGSTVTIVVGQYTAPTPTTPTTTTTTTTPSASATTPAAP